MEPWLEVVVVAADSPELGSDRDTVAGEGSSPARKRPRRSPSRTETPMEWEPLEPAGQDRPTWGTPSWPCSTSRSRCSISPSHWTTDHWDPTHEWPKEPAGPRKLADESAPASGGLPSLVPCSSQSQPAARSDPRPSASCHGTRDLARQRSKKPARSKRWKSMGNRGLAAIVPLVQGILSAFASGLRLAKLLELMRNQHGVDMEALCRAESAPDVLGLLAQVPGLGVRTPERGPQCLIQLKRALADEYAPAPGGPPRLAPCSSQSQPALHLDPGFSASCRPGRGDVVRQQPKKPARSKRRKSMGDGDVVATLAPFLGHVLHPFPLGLGLPKLLEAVRRDHDLDLMVLSREAGYNDVLGLLGQVPGIWLHKSSRGSTYTVHLHAALADESALAPGGPPIPATCSSQSQPAPCSDPGSSASCRPGRGDLAQQQPKRWKSMGDGGVAATLAPFLWNILRPFPLGLGLPKLLEAVRQDHDLDLVVLSREAGYKDMLGLLGQVPRIWLHKSSRGSTYTVHLHAAPWTPTPADLPAGGVMPPKLGMWEGAERPGGASLMQIRGPPGSHPCLSPCGARAAWCRGRGLGDTAAGGSPPTYKWQPCSLSDGGM
ncbi:uncharacterized protein LOC119846896 [Dermochelys coriacea]|uniref:uncharacterized protein LOC119846896 n=1 Tax=Dermochelys coriacea TaxID=27794 RepID=UPI0018E6F0F5|nr:uncharacterized protein LOC119846896 [Dermochelys coriacea]